VIIESMIKDAGSSGWMAGKLLPQTPPRPIIRLSLVSVTGADFGEYVPFEAHLHEGMGVDLHNVFPDYWASLQREAVEDGGAAGEACVFQRSGWLRTPGKAQLYWVGDQLVTWDGHDGIKTVLPAMLSGGLMGNSLSHSDVGGYTMIDHILFKFFRPRELLFRWIELGAFAGAIFRSHLGSFMTTPSAQIWDDDESIAHYARFTRIFALLAPYRRALMHEALVKGYPLVRPLLLHFPGDPTAVLMWQQFLLGEDLLVAPVLDPGRSRMRVYLPAVEGGWVDVWTNALHGKDGTAGEWVMVSAPLGQPPVFYRYNSRFKHDIFEKIPGQ
jgi:sulfoquinovosidase